MPAAHTFATRRTRLNRAAVYMMRGLQSAAIPVAAAAIVAAFSFGGAGCGDSGAVGIRLEAATNGLSGYNGLVFAEGCALPVAVGTDVQSAMRGLSHRAEATAALPTVTVEYPWNGTVFPPDLTAPTFLWHETAVTADVWLVTVVMRQGAMRFGFLVSGARPAEVMDTRLVTEGGPTMSPHPPSARGWRPDEDVWSLIRQHAVDSPARVTIIGLRRSDSGKPVSRGNVTLTTSRDPVGAPIFYRDVPLMPSATETGVIKPLPTSMLPLVEWRLRDVSQPVSRLMLTNLYTCANCHSFSADGKTLGMDVDGPTGDKGAYALVPVATDTVIRADGIITWNAFKNKLPDRNTIGFLSRVSPDGRYVVSTVNEEVYVANFTNYRFLQVFYPTRGIFAWYDRDTGEFQALPGADNPQFVHCDAVWSPDGQWLVFARARARDAYPRGRNRATYANDPQELPIQYDLYRMPFNHGRGGTPEPIAGAANDGLSHSFPAISPDGRWIVFVVCRNGQLMRPDSTLWILPFAGGIPRKMHCNTSLMNSWHSFSPNSRWLVFSSKANTPYTQMFLTHIDGEGNDTPPVLVENATAANRAVNIPEFVNVSYEGFQRISTPTLAYYADFQRGSELAETGRIREAVEAYSVALRSNPDDSRVRNDLGVALGRLGKLDEAAVHFRKVIEINPGKPQAYANLALVLLRMGKLDEAIGLYDQAIRLDATIPDVWYSRGRVHQKQGDSASALADYTETIRLAPDYVSAYVDRGSLLAAQGNLADALRNFEKAVALDPQSPGAWYARGRARLQQGDEAGAARDFRKCLEVAPPQWESRAQVQELLGTKPNSR